MTDKKLLAKVEGKHHDQKPRYLPEIEYTDAPPPCELNYAGRICDHPRYPSGDCVICGALCTEGCKHWLAVGEWTPLEN